MIRQRPKALQSLLTRRSLRQFHDFTERYRRWQQVLARCLNESQLNYCRVLNLRDSCLVIEVSSAAWATRLKLQQSRIITHFNQDATASVTSVQIKVNPEAFKPTQNPVKIESKPDSNRPTKESAAPEKASAPAPKANSAETLRAQAEMCEEPLRSQLLQLAATFAAATKD
ncbi:hypothetical protein SAMN06297229_0471 [Pseudidiomarina planktonica]|uniref:DUF721 domain-containing protein n=1 Tax=Pseudidiomarina planktonica TaxID=1323738 RepID=A0A1Y6EEH2_9GAMM|nr:DUF721 domain-containing protein [Pseudidiomarina planktonica]RUO66054.1 DUF721 domain-containing protein [Pseudidiomarina planktonica]SMQ60809.1 hypothetical protein SAMN06297229_0471 [Pseudidiomarina planktonica]